MEYVALIIVTSICAVGTWIMLKRTGMWITMYCPWVGDFFWVLQAFLRGKVLRQRAYRPQMQGSFFLMPVPCTVRRISMLMKWWGYRMMTLEEIGQMRISRFDQLLMEMWRPTPSIYLDKNGFVQRCTPPLRWDGEKWDWGSSDDRNDTLRFRTVRK